MPPKRKPPPSASASPGSSVAGGSPRTPVAHKQKRLNPPRLCIPKPTAGASTGTFSGRLTRGRRKIQLANSEDDEHEEDDIQNIDPQPGPSSQIGNPDPLEKSFEKLAIKKKNSTISSLTTDIDFMNIIDADASSIGESVKVMKRNKEKTKEQTSKVVPKKTVTMALPPISESDWETQSSNTVFKTPTAAAPKTRMTQNAKAKAIPRNRDISELDTISLVEDTMGDNFECFTKNVVYRDFELSSREDLVQVHAQLHKKVAELRRLTDVALIGFSQDFKNRELADLLNYAGNPESAAKFVNTYGTKKNENVVTPPPRVKSQSVNKSCPKEAQINLRKCDEELESDHEHHSGTGSYNTSNSPDLFDTPEKQVIPSRPPVPPKTLKSAMKGGQPVFPTPKEMNFGGAENPNPENKVFQFIGTPDVTVKAPRTVRPGEIAFSKSGSPIVAAPLSLVPRTPVQPPGVKTVRIQVENPDGRSIEVDIICRGNPNEESDAKLFRAFMTDVRGVVTARSTARGKRMLPGVVPPRANKNTSRVPQTEQKPGPSKKPMWL